MKTTSIVMALGIAVLPQAFLRHQRWRPETWFNSTAGSGSFRSPPPRGRQPRPRS